MIGREAEQEWEPFHILHSKGIRKKKGRLGIKCGRPNKVPIVKKWFVSSVQKFSGFIRTISMSKKT